jgi:acetyl-CoA acetyltransferase family protein
MSESDSNSNVGLAILSGVRTPFCRSFGQLVGVRVDDLARVVFIEALARAGIADDRIEEVILGCAGQPLDAMNVARVAALRAGIAERVPAFTVHRNCASGLEAIDQALLRAHAGKSGPWLVGGAESMTDAPFQARRTGARSIIEFGRAKGALGKLRSIARMRIADLLPRSTLMGALTDPISGLIMGDTAEVLAREWAIPRTEQDAFAAMSHTRAREAIAAGKLAEEIVPFIVPPKFAVAIEQDDGPRDDSTPERLARLRPVFDRRFGTVTVGNSCQLTDGAAAMVVVPARQAAHAARPALGYVRDSVTVGCDPRRMGLGPAHAIPELLRRNRLSSADVDLFEINEAFAVQVLACLRLLGADAPPIERLNVNGGAIALGHPVGATGVRIVLTLLLELRRRGLRRGIASLCVGGGQGVAMLVESGP